MRSRNIKKQIWLSYEEDRMLKHKADKTGMNEATLIRNLVLGFEPKEKPDDRFYDVMKQMYSIGNNLNQIARKANSLNFIDASFYKNEAKKIEELVLEIKNSFLLP